LYTPHNEPRNSNFRIAAGSLSTGLFTCQKPGRFLGVAWAGLSYKLLISKNYLNLHGRVPAGTSTAHRAASAGDGHHRMQTPDEASFACGVVY
jgi:hypothetical protein